MLDIDPKIEDLLVEWQLARSQHRELSTAELCVDCPELVEQVADQIKKLKAMSWASDPSSLIPEEEGHDTPFAADTTLRESDVTVEEFVTELSNSGVLNDADLERVEAHAKTHSHDNARTLAECLIHLRLITQYQARVILERRDSPLLLDRYVILDAVGAGGMGVVFKALHQSLERIVAIKVLAKHAVNSAERAARFQREIRAVAKVSHPNVVQAFDAHESNGICFFVMEYVNGDDLGTIVDRDGCFNVNDSVSIVSQTAAGLAAAHGLGIVHRDVKPGNVMLSRDGTAKVLDLGLVKSRDGMQTIDKNLTEDGLSMGTVNYMSPEQALNARSADERSDIYSLGATLYFLLHGRPMFDRCSAVETLVAHRETPAPTLGDGRDDFPGDLELLFQEMVAKEPNQRPLSMAEVHDRLIPLASCNEPQPTSTQSTPSRIGVGLRSLLTAAALLIVGVAAVPAFNWVRSSSVEQFLRDAIDDGSMTLDVDRNDGLHVVDHPNDLPQSMERIHGVSVVVESSLDLTPLAELPSIRRVEFWVADQSIEYGAPVLDGLESLQPVLDELSFLGCRLDENQIESIAEFDGLTLLHMDYCELPSNLSKLANLKKLERLSLIDADASDGQLAWIRQLSHLTYLDLSGTDVTASVLQSLAGASDLSQLMLSGASITGDLGVLSQCPNLVEVLVDETNLADGQMDAVASLQQITSLDISHSKVTDAGVEKAAKMDSLEKLSLQGLAVRSSMEAISKMKSLTVLDLSCTDLDDSGLRTLASNRQLRVLCVAETDTSVEEIARIQRQLPQCRVVEHMHEVFSDAQTHQ